MYFPFGVLTYSHIATIAPIIIKTGIYQYAIATFITLWNHSVILGNLSFEPNSSYTFCIAGIATNVPTTNITINNANCIKFGINMFLNFLFTAFVSSRYFTACSNEFVNDPDNSPTFIILI